MTEQDPNRRHFAALLKAFREARGLSRAELGDLAGYSESTIKSFETGQRAVQVYHARHFDEAFKLDGIFEHQAKQFGKAGFAVAYGAFTDVLEEADDVYWFEHSLIPGLFQTERYARAILATYPRATQSLIDQRVTARLAVQAVLQRTPQQLLVWALLDEAALRRRVGDAEVMHDQLTQLIKASRLPGVSLQVLPGLEGYGGLVSAFAIAERRGHPSIVHVEGIPDGQVTDEPAVVEPATELFKWLQTRALPVNASQDLIAKVDDEQWKVPARSGARALTAVQTEQRV